MSETMAELSLTLSERHTADFEMIGNGGFAPLTGFQGSADWERVCSEMRTVDGTADEAHPGVAAIYEEGNRMLAGPIEVDALPDHDEAFMRRYKTPAEHKADFEARGWKRIVAFQTRNPIHRAHEYLTKAALETCD